MAVSAKRPMDPRLDAKYREKIDVAQIINRLQIIAKGQADCTSTQIKAAEILLRKVLPDLANVQVSGDESNPVEMIVTWRSSK